MDRVSSSELQEKESSRFEAPKPGNSWEDLKPQDLMKGESSEAQESPPNRRSNVSEGRETTVSGKTGGPPTSANCDMILTKGSGATVENVTNPRMATLMQTIAASDVNEDKRLHGRGGEENPSKKVKTH